jgi:hypothetical protein
MVSATTGLMMDSLIYRCRSTPGWMPVLLSED